MRQTRKLKIVLTCGVAYAVLAHGGRLQAADRCADGEFIPCNTLITGSNVGADIDGDTTCQGVTTINGPDVWYRYLAVSSGSLTATTCTGLTTFDTVVSIHRACPGHGGNQLDCSDDDCAGYSLASTAVASVTRDTIYFIRVSGYAGATGSFGLVLSGSSCNCPDCNSNMICDANEGLSDCNSDGTPDTCQTLEDCNTNGQPDACESADCDHNGVLDPCEPQSDCNQNGVYDICEGPTDCNTNSIFDPCEQLADCNSNRTPDACDVVVDPFVDRNSDGIPDSCQLDCNTNFMPDVAESDPDCNHNDQLDVCDIGYGLAVDCNTNNLLDGCEGALTDCNSNQAADLCEVLSGDAPDVNTNRLPDSCEPDCNHDAIPDNAQELADCDSNGSADVCEIEAGQRPDCNLNGTPDDCESSEDCNTNVTPDTCEIALASVPDRDQNGEPDECAPEIVITLGDCNVSDQVDGDDIQYIVNCLLDDMPAGSDCYCADINTDGEVDDEDVSEFTIDVTGAGGCTVDLGIDSNNNGRLADDRAADDLIELLAPGKVIALNDDDDNANATADLDDAAGTIDPDLVAIILSSACDVADRRWRLAYTATAMRVYTAQDRTESVAADTLRPFPMPGLLYVEGRGVAFDERIQLDITNADGSEVLASDAVKATVVSIKLNSDLNIDGQNAIDANDDPLKRTRGAYVVVNNDDDDDDDTVDTADQYIRDTGTAPSRNEDNLKRFTLSNLTPVALRTSGTVILTRSSGNLRVFGDPRKGITTGNDTALLFASTSQGFRADVNGNGHRSWDLAVEAQRTAFRAVVAGGLFVEGLAPSSAERTERITVSYRPAGSTMPVELDRIDVTVVQFLGITATVTATPARHEQMGNSALDHVYQTRRGEIVHALDESIEDATTNTTDGGSRRFNFSNPIALVLPRNADDSVELVVNRSPELAVTWMAPRAADDHADVGTNALPIAGEAGANRAQFDTNERGSFLVTCYLDINGNGMFDSGELRTILPLVLVHPSSPVDATTGNAARIQIARHGTHTTWSRPHNAGGGGMQVNTGVFELEHPDRAAIHRSASVVMIGGGPTGRRGRDRTFISWCQNLTAHNYRGRYQGAPDIQYLFVQDLPNVILPGNRRAFFGNNPPPVPLQLPLLDTGFPGDGLAGAGLGGESVRPMHQSVRTITPHPPIGRHLQVDAVDSPGDFFFGSHPRVPNRVLQNVNYGLSFSAHLVCWSAADGNDDARASNARNDAARRAYVVVDSVNWSVAANWNITPEGVAIMTPGGTPTVAVGAPTLYDPPAAARNVAIEVRFPTVLRQVAYDMR